jgi:hypothetical protein
MSKFRAIAACYMGVLVYASFIFLGAGTLVVGLGPRLAIHRTSSVWSQ